MSLRIGLGKADITSFEPGKVMLGWAHPQNVSQGVHEPLFARALVLHEAKRSLAYVVCDLCMITVAVRQGVIERLAQRRPHISQHAVMLTATHTHSGPSGFSAHAFYNMGCFGFSPTVYEAIVSGIVAAIEAADDRAVPGRGVWQRGEIPTAHTLAFNRSMKAYNQNPDVAHEHRPERAVDREATCCPFETNKARRWGLCTGSRSMAPACTLRTPSCTRTTRASPRDCSRRIWPSAGRPTSSPSLRKARRAMSPPTFATAARAGR